MKSLKDNLLQYTEREMEKHYTRAKKYADWVAIEILKQAKEGKGNTAALLQDTLIDHFSESVFNNCFMLENRDDLKKKNFYKKAILRCDFDENGHPIYSLHKENVAKLYGFLLDNGKYMYANTIFGREPMVPGVLLDEYDVSNLKMYVPRAPRVMDGHVIEEFYTNFLEGFRFERDMLINLIWDVYCCDLEEIPGKDKWDKQYRLIDVRSEELKKSHPGERTMPLSIKKDKDGKYYVNRDDDTHTIFIFNTEMVKWRGRNEFWEKYVRAR